MHIESSKRLGMLKKKKRLGMLPKIMLHLIPL